MASTAGYMTETYTEPHGRIAAIFDCTLSPRADLFTLSLGPILWRPPTSPGRTPQWSHISPTKPGEQTPVMGDVGRRGMVSAGG